MHNHNIEPKCLMWNGMATNIELNFLLHKICIWNLYILYKLIKIKLL